MTEASSACSVEAPDTERKHHITPSLHRNSFPQRGHDWFEEFATFRAFLRQAMTGTSKCKFDCPEDAKGPWGTGILKVLSSLFPFIIAIFPTL